MNLRALFATLIVFISLGTVAVSVLPHLYEPLDMTPPDSIPAEYANDWRHIEIDDSGIYGEGISSHSTMMYGLAGYSVINYVEGEISNEETENITLDDLNSVECEGEGKDNCEAMVLASKVGIYGSYAALGIGLLGLLFGLAATFNIGSPKITAVLIVILSIIMIGYAGFHAATFPPLFEDMDYSVKESPGLNVYLTIGAGVVNMIAGCLVFTSETDDW